MIENSKFWQSMPCSARPKTCPTEERLAWSMKPHSARLMPSTSDFVKPVMLERFSFHSLTRPSWSTPRMGALAESISRCRSLAIPITSCSAFFRSVMSWPTPMTPIGFEFASTRVVAFSSTSTFLPERE